MTSHYEEKILLNLIYSASKKIALCKFKLDQTKAYMQHIEEVIKDHFEDDDCWSNVCVYKASDLKASKRKVSALESKLKSLEHEHTFFKDKHSREFGIDSLKDSDDSIKTFKTLKDILKELDDEFDQWEQ